MVTVEMVALEGEGLDVLTPPIPTYPQFLETNIPAGSGAIQAFRGYIRPFSDDATACRVLRAIIANQALNIASGRLDCDAAGLPIHPLEKYLTNMAEPCTVVIVEFAGKEHPRAYLLAPIMTRRLSMSGHVRDDKTLMIEGQRLPALCIYSGNLFKYDESVERLPQFLNQLTTYLAKHLIFLRTRRRGRIGRDLRIEFLEVRAPEEPVNPNWLRIGKRNVWFGHWIGPSAPMGVSQHLQTIARTDECWCNSGKLYKNCHRKDEVAKCEPSFRLSTVVRGIQY